MRERWSLSLFQKIFFIGVSCLVVSLWSITLMNIYTFREGYLISLQSHASALALHYSEELRRELVQGRTFDEAAQGLTGFSLIQKYSHLQGMLKQVALSDGNGKLVAINDTPVSDSQLAPALLQVLESPTLEDPLLPHLMDRPPYYEVYVPLLFENRRIGYLITSFDAEVIDAKIYQGIRDTALFTLAALGLTGVALMLSVRRYITDPLRRIIKKIRYITQSGDLSTRVTVEARDEFFTLVAHFNRMIEELTKKEQALQASARELAQKNAELKKFDQLKDEFLTNTSHEFRTPLTGMIGLAEGLLVGSAGELSETAKNHLALIINSGLRLNRLVNDILDFSRMRKHSLILQTKPLGIWEAVDVVMTLSQPLLGNKPITLINAVSPGLPPIQADENRFEQILHNIIGNAIKFTHQGIIRVTAQVQGEMVEMAVSDTGIGIAPEKLNSIFEPFHQLDGSTTRPYGGTGLGLSVSRTLIILHGGELKVHSVLGAGSTFTMTFPKSNETSFKQQLPASVNPFFLTEASPEASHPPFRPETEFLPQAPSFEPLTPQLSQRARILVVDDESINLQTLMYTLAAENYLVQGASDGQEALHLLTKKKPDLVLLDVMMPGMTGFEVCQKIRQHYPLEELPVLFLTAKTQISDLLEGFRLQANDYLIKPFSRGELLARVRQHLDLAEAHQSLKQANLRLALLLELMRSMAISQDKLAVLTQGALALLQQIPVQSTDIRLGISFRQWKMNSHENYVHFQLFVPKGLSSLENLGPAEACPNFLCPLISEPVLWNSAQVRQSKISMQGEQFSLPIFHDNQWLACLEGQGFQSEFWLETHHQFIETLANLLALALKNIDFKQETAEYLRHEQEFKVAHAIQQALFPKQLPRVPCLELASFFRSAAETGRDWYGFMTQIENNLLIMIGDVTGHGLPSALVTATASAACRTLEEVYYQLYQEPSPARLQEYLNKVIFAAGHPHFLMTFFIARIDLESGLMTFSNAAHHFPVLLKANGRLRRLINVNGHLGRQAERRFSESSVQLEVGDTLLFYTEGVIEQMNSREKTGGEHHLLHFLKQRSHSSAHEVIEYLTGTFAQFPQENHTANDITLLTCKVIRPFSHQTYCVS